MRLSIVEDANKRKEMNRQSMFESVIGSLSDGPFCYQFNEANILGNDTKPFLHFFDVERIRSAGRLNALMGRIDFSVDGFHDNNVVLHQIPEVVAYFRALSEKWPYFFFADSLKTGFLTTLMLCLIRKSLTKLSDREPDDFQTVIDPTDFNDAARPLFVGLQKTWGMSMPETSQKQFDARVESLHGHLKRGISPF